MALGTAVGASHGMVSMPGGAECQWQPAVGEHTCHSGVPGDLAQNAFEVIVREGTAPALVGTGILQQAIGHRFSDMRPTIKVVPAGVFPLYTIFDDLNSFP